MINGFMFRVYGLRVKVYGLGFAYLAADHQASSRRGLAVYGLGFMVLGLNI